VSDARRYAYDPIQGQGKGHETLKFRNSYSISPPPLKFGPFEMFDCAPIAKVNYFSLKNLVLNMSPIYRPTNTTTTTTVPGITRSSAIAGRPCDAKACQRMLKWTWK